MFEFVMIDSVELSAIAVLIPNIFVKHTVDIDFYSIILYFLENVYRLTLWNELLFIAISICTFACICYNSCLITLMYTLGACVKL